MGKIRLSEYEEFESKYRNLKKIFEKIDNYFDLDAYKIKFKEIEKKLEEINNGKNTQEDLNYGSYTKTINKITEEINKEYMPYYEIHLLSIHIEELINGIDETNYNDLKKVCIELIDCINSVQYKNKDDIKEIFAEAYKTIYKSLCYESVFDRDEICKYVKLINRESINENIGLLISEDIKELSEADQINIELNHRKEGLGSNYLSNDVIKKIGFLKYKDERHQFEDRRKTVAMEILDKASSFNEENDKLNNVNDERLKILKRYSSDRFGIYTKRIILFLLPVIIGFVSGHFLGKIVTDYKVTKKVYNKETKKIINDENYYDDVSYQYKMEIKMCSPWHESENSKGYDREITEWTYMDKSDSDSVDPDEVIRELDKDKKTHFEHIDVLSESDNTTEPEIIVTEYIVDKSDGVSTGKYSIFGLIFGMFGVIPFAGYHDGGKMMKDGVRLEAAKKALSKLIKRKVIKESYVKIGDKRVKLQEEIKEAKDIYGDLMDEYSLDELESVKKYIYKK